jgi:hypothetical protein
MSRAKSTARSANPNRDATRIFHREWLGLAQPIEGLVFSVPALDEAPVPAIRTELTSALRALLTATHDAAAPVSEGNLAIRSADELFRRLLGYDATGMLVPRASLPAELAFYAPESRQEIRPSFAIARGPFEADPDDPFAIFEEPKAEPATASTEATGTAPSSPYIALVWDLGDDGPTRPASRSRQTRGPHRLLALPAHRQARAAPPPHRTSPIGLLTSGPRAPRRSTRPQASPPRT